MEPAILGFIRDILFRLQHEGFPEAICAGGAIRDIDNGMDDQVKDIDIVIFDRPGYLADLKAAMPGFQHRVAVIEEVANYLAFENVACVHEFTRDGEVPVQIVVAKTKRSVLEILERHDFGICQIGFKGFGFICTGAYNQDKTNRTFTLVRCRDKADYCRSANRYARLVKKYFGWSLVTDHLGELK